MARYIGPACRLCRAEQRKMFLKGDRCKSDKCPINRKRPAPGKGPKARTNKMSEYGLELREKQKVKRTYGLMERQFHNYFEKALRMPGITGENLLMMLERRLDNVVYRMRFATSRAQARQIVTHGHITVNGKRVNIPSYQVRPNDVIAVHETSKKLIVIKDALKEFSKSGVASWIEVDPDTETGKFLAVPRRNEITELADIKEQLIVELYSK
jgi:small subunit ribosomal protein S4